MPDWDQHLSQTIEALDQTQKGIAETLGRVVELLLHMGKVRKFLALLAGMAFIATLTAVVILMFLISATNSSSRSSASSSNTAARASVAAEMASTAAAKASQDAVVASENSQRLLDTVNNLLDPNGEPQRRNQEVIRMRNDQLYCVVLIANQVQDLGPACDGTIELLRERGVLVP